MMEAMVCDQVIKGTLFVFSGRSQLPLGKVTQGALGKAPGVRN